MLSALQMDMTPAGQLPLWKLREVLDNSELFLSKMHIHVRIFHLSFHRQHLHVLASDFPIVQAKSPKVSQAASPGIS